MTAKHVMGLRVLSEFPVPTGHNQKPNGVDNGVPAMFKQIVGLRLSNGAVAYGCVHCDYARDTIRSVIPHLNKHGVKGDGQTPKAQRVAAASTVAKASGEDLSGLPALSHADLRAMSMDDILRLVNKARRAISRKQGEDATDWKRRALEAESKLEVLRSVFGRDIG